MASTRVCTHLSLGLCSCCTKTPNVTQSINNIRRSVHQEATVTVDHHGDHERRWGYTTDLVMYDDPWKIKKELKNSDLGHMSRLLLGRDLAEDLVLPVLGDFDKESGIQVRVLDVDTNSMHSLTFKRWTSSKCYVFMGRWVKDFVARRGLKKGDLIGLHWDSYNNHFNFSVLQHF